MKIYRFGQKTEVRSLAPGRARWKNFSSVFLPYPRWREKADINNIMHQNLITVPSKYMELKTVY